MDLYCTLYMCIILLLRAHAQGGKVIGCVVVVVVVVVHVVVVVVDTKIAISRDKGV